MRHIPALTSKKTRKKAFCSSEEVNCIDVQLYHRRILLLAKEGRKKFKTSRFGLNALLFGICPMTRVKITLTLHRGPNHKPIRRRVVPDLLTLNARHFFWGIISGRHPRGYPSRSESPPPRAVAALREPARPRWRSSRSGGSPSRPSPGRTSRWR